MDTCSKPNCNYPVMNKKYMLCQVHNWERLHAGKNFFEEQSKKQQEYNEKMLEKQRQKPKKVYEFKAKQTPIKSVSKKMSKKLSEYSVVKSKYMKQHAVCEVYLCFNASTDIHHKKGREGELLTDTKYFMAVCRQCHTVIEDNPEWAKSKGYSLNRLS